MKLSPQYGTAFVKTTLIKKGINQKKCVFETLALYLTLMFYENPKQTMKKILLAPLFLLFAVASTAQVNWMTFEEAEEALKKEPRKLLIDVYTLWCGPCKMMEAQTFNNPKIAEYINKNFYAVKFNAEGADPVKFKGQTFENTNYQEGKRGRNSTHQLAYAIAGVNGRLSYPTIVYMDEDLNIISPVPGFMRPPQIEPLLHFIVEEAYENIEYEEYRNNFESKL